MTGDRARSRVSHPVLFRVLAIGLGLFVAVAALDIAVRQGLLGDRRQAGVPSRPNEPDLHPAVHLGYEVTPWFSLFGGRAFGQRTQLVPLSVIVCDTHVGRGEEPTCRNGRQNSSGFRLPEFTIAHPPDTFRVVIVGDSFTWGDGVELAQTYHRLLQARFDREWVSPAPKVEIVALGVNGSNFPDNVTRLMTFGARLQPDLALVQFFNNDLQYRATQDLLASADNDSYTDFLMETTAAGRLLRDELQRLRRSDKWMVELERAYDPSSQEWGIFESVLAALDAWRTASGVPVAFLSFPDVDTCQRRANYDHFEHPPPTYSLVARAEHEIERRKFPLLRVLDAFRARAGDRFLAVSKANAHFGPLAHELAADAIFGFLTRADWIDTFATAGPGGKRVGGRAGAAGQGRSRLDGLCRERGRAARAVLEPSGPLPG